MKARPKHRSASKPRQPLVALDIETLGEPWLAYPDPRKPASGSCAARPGALPSPMPPATTAPVLAKTKAP